MSRKHLLDQLAFYGAYHNNKWNQLIHIIFVPLIWWASIILVRTLVAKYLFDSLAYGVIFAAYFFYVSYYIYLGDYPVAISYNLILTAIFMHCNYFYEAYENAWVWALFAKAFGWWIQIAIGHTRLEGRKPALLDSLFDAVVMAPLFTWYEVLFAAGFRRDFKRKLDSIVAKKILALNRAKTSTD